MPVGRIRKSSRKSSGQKKPNPRQRRQKQSRLGQGVQAYAVQAYADDVPHDHRRLAVKRSVELVKEAVKRAVKLDDEARCKAMKMEEDPTESYEDEDEATSNAAKLEETDSDPSGLDRTGLDDDDHDHGMICDHAKLSHNMAKLLRHTAYNDQLLDDDGWLPLITALPRLHCTAAEATQAVEQSDRCDDDWGLGARFEMYISGSRAWIRATDGAYYRDRSQKPSQKQRRH